MNMNNYDLFGRLILKIVKIKKFLEFMTKLGFLKICSQIVFENIFEMFSIIFIIF